MDPQPAAARPTTGNERLRRSSWKADAIRRGEIKISEPIPLDDDMGIALTKRHTDPMISQLVDEVSRQTSEQRDAHSDGDEPLPSEWEKDAQHEMEQSERRSRQHHLSKSIELPTMETRHRHHASLDPSITFKNSTQGTMAFAEGPDGPPNNKGKKKRRSGLRSVFRKMFGRKSKDEGKGDGAISRQDHFSQETEPAFPQPPKELEEAAAAAAALRNARQFSVPFEELQPRMPLGSHLPFPMNVNAPVEVSPPHDYLTFEEGQPPPRFGHRRRNTLPSMVFSSADVAAMTAEFVNLDAQASRPVTAASPTQGSEIGVAVTGPANRRRSRSAGDLQALVRDQTSPVEAMPTVTRTGRRRSAEIRYWRASMARSVSMYSEGKNAAAEGKEGGEEAGAENRDTVVLDPEHIRAFNFGNFSSGSVNSHEISRTPTMTEQSTVSYDDTPLRDDASQSFVEQASPVAIRRADHPIILDEPPKGKRSSREDSSSSNSTNRVLGLYQTPTAPSPVLAAAPPPPPTTTFLTSHSPTDPLGRTHHHAATTAFPNISSSSFNISSQPSYTSLHASPLDALQIHLPTLSNPDFTALAASSTTPLSTAKAAEQFAAVHTILRHERAARKALEQQVLALARDIADLRALNAALVAQQQAHHAGIHAQHMHFSRPKRTSAEEEKRQTVISRFSIFDSGDEAEVEAEADADKDKDKAKAKVARDGHRAGAEAEADAEAETDDAASARSPEVFETPREEAAPYGFGFGGVGPVGRPVVVEGGQF